MDNNEKKKSFWEYILQSLSGAGSLILAILFFFVLYNLGRFFRGIGALIGILMPLIYGLVIAFILGPMSEWWESLLLRFLPEMKNVHRRHMICRTLGVALAVITALAIVVIVLVLVIPQLFSSIVSLVNSVPGASARMTAWVQKILADNPDMQSQVLSTYNDASSTLLDWVQNTLLPRFQELMNGLSTGVLGLVSLLKNLILGLIISVYLMFNTRNYLSQTKKIIYTILPVNAANRLLFTLREVKVIFSGFLIGKLLDSLIIGMICFICMTLLNFPYTILISTIVGVTNVIPYFGPFIGAIPSAVLVLTVSPWQALYFLIFILVLQQVDGNIIGPKILGNATGLSSFWVLISLLLFGGVFGFIGMVIGVPVFAVLYDLVRQGIQWILQKRQLPQKLSIYRDIDHFDPLTKEPVLKDPRLKEEEERKRLEEREREREERLRRRRVLKAQLQNVRKKIKP